jgi:hypothetical protein
MANAATVNSLVPIIRSRLNITNLNTITDAEIKVFIRSSMASLYEKIANKHRDYYVIPWRLSLAANQDKYALPTDFRSAVQVFATFGTGNNLQRLPLDQFTLNKYQTQSVSSLIAPQWPTMYRIMGLTIYFTPTPSTDYNNAIEMWYVPQFRGPVNDDASIDAQMPNGWETWIEYDVCVQIAMRMRLAEYYAMYLKERDTVEHDVMTAVVIRDEQPQYMTDAFDTPWFGLNQPGEQ